MAEVPIELSEANESLDESLMDSISFSHKIEDAGIIAKVELIEEESAKKRLRRFVILPVVGIAFLLVLFAAMWIRGFPATLAYEITTPEHSNIRVRIATVKDDYLVEVGSILISVEVKSYFRQKCRKAKYNSFLRDRKIKLDRLN